MIVVSHQHPVRRFSKGETLRTVHFVLRRESAGKRHISVVFTNDRFMKKINTRYLGHPRVTDVIAFPLEDETGPDAEVYVNLDQASRQATEYGVSRAEEVRRLLIHGVLHLLGYRDSTDRQRGTMRRREDVLLAGLKKG